jgi:hypothetical protein
MKDKWTYLAEYQEHYTTPPGRISCVRQGGVPTGLVTGVA